MPRPDIDVRAVAWTSFAIGATILVVVCAVFVLLHFWRVAPGADRLLLPYALAVDGPALQSAPQPDLGAERAAKARILTTSGWVDDAHGIVRIPIATAMRVLAAAGSASDAGAAAAAPDTASSIDPAEVASAPAAAARASGSAR